MISELFALAPERSDFSVIECADEAAWLAQRVNGIGASESSALYDVNPFESLYSLWVRKRQKIAISLEESEAMEWGKRLEDPIAQAYADKTGRTLLDLGRRTILVSVSDPHMFATLDRVVTSKRYPGVLEIKATGEFRRDDWDDGEWPLNYQCQVQHQLAVTGYQWASVAVLIGGNKFGWRDIERNDEFIADLRARCAAFWQRVESGEAPEVDGSKHTTEALMSLYGKHNGPVVDLSAVSHADAELQEVNVEIAELKEQADLLKNQIREAMGDATFGALPSGAKWSITTGPRAGYTVEPTTVTTMRRLNAPKAKTKKTKATSAEQTRMSE